MILAPPCSNRTDNLFPYTPSSDLAVAGDRQTRRVDAQAVRRIDQPAEGGPGIVDGRRKPVLGSHAIIDRHDDHPRAAAEIARDHVVRIEVDRKSTRLNSSH